MVIFGERKMSGTTWVLGNKIIDQVSSYKYLGLDIKGNLKWDVCKKRLAQKAKRTMAVALGMSIRSEFVSVKAPILI